MYAKIIIDIAHEKLDRVFEYRIPEDLLQSMEEGMEVEVPFGNGNTRRKGYIVGFTDRPEYDDNKIKNIIQIAPKSRAIEGRMVRLAAWMRSHYGGTMIQSLKTVIPIKTKEKIRKKRSVILTLTEEEAREKLDFYLNKNQRARARLLAGLLDQPQQEYEWITKKLNVTAAVIKSLEEQGVLRIESEDALRNPVGYKRKEKDQKTFTKEQMAAIDTFRVDYENGVRGMYLLFGVTGSGKTEVYIEMIRQVVEKGLQAIVLIPEIALTYQTVLRFYGQFGDRVSIMNSRLSKGERSDQIERVKRGEVDVMIGPRSALFTPFEKLGLIVIDEEHETTYKSEQVPRYHARETALARAEMEGASVVLGSATPSLEAYYACERGRGKMLRLSERATEQTLPRVYISDMRRELKKGNTTILSDRLSELMAQRLAKKQQIMLFLNRRGFSSFVSCRACGHVVKCPHCDVSLTIHQGNKLVCHYCDHRQEGIRVCPECGSGHIGGFKAGTQQVQEVVQKAFPGARVLRMDKDTTKGKEGHEEILSAFSNYEADILIGTQMIVKGHDFPGVTLVGILAADMSLYNDDYRSAERTFQLLTQAAGRAGRGKEPGEVVIQTYNPEHYSIQRALNQDYTGFYQEEMKFRKMMGYPPAAELLAILVTAENEQLLDTAMGHLKNFVQRADRQKTARIIGPASPSVGRIADLYRRAIYIKCEDRKVLEKIKDLTEQYIELNRGFDPVRVQFDFNPVKSF